MIGRGGPGRGGVRAAGIGGGFAAGFASRHVGGSAGGSDEDKDASRLPGEAVRVSLPDGTVVLHRVRVARTFGRRLKGLMFEANLPPGEGLLIPGCRAVHSCFMMMPVDVLFLSETGRVEHVIVRMRPWTFSPVVRSAAHVLECGAGTAERYGIREGVWLTVG